MTTQRDVEVPSGTPEDHQPPGQDGVDLAGSRYAEITQRGKVTVGNYVGDLRAARVLRETPPNLAELIGMLWHRPQVLAGSGLLRFLVRLYALVAVPIVVVLYLWMSAHFKPAVAIVVDGLLVLAVWMWLFS